MPQQHNENTDDTSPSRGPRQDDTAPGAGRPRPAGESPHEPLRCPNAGSVPFVPQTIVCYGPRRWDLPATRGAITSNAPPSPGAGPAPSDEQQPPTIICPPAPREQTREPQGAKQPPTIICPPTPQEQTGEPQGAEQPPTIICPPAPREQTGEPQDAEQAGESTSRD